MRGVTQVEAVAAMPADVCSREGADGNRERLLSGRAGARLAFSREDACDVQFHGQIDGCGGSIRSKTHANGSPGAGTLEVNVCDVLTVRHCLNHETQENHETVSWFHGSRPRKRALCCQMYGRLTMSW